MKKTTLIGMLFFAVALHSQNFEWVKTPLIDFDMNTNMLAYSTTADPAGNVYFTGFKANPFNYEVIMGDQYFNKYSASGDLVFSKEFSGNVDIDYLTSDSQGNILMAIGYVNEFEYEGTVLSTTAQGVQHHLMKFDTQGNLLWQQPVTITDWFVNGFMSIAFDADDNIYIGYDDYQHSYIRKMSPEGVTSFTIEQENAARISSVSIDNEGNIYAAGSCAAPQATFGGVAAGTDFPYNTFAVKYSPAGVFHWIKFVEDITCAAPIIIARTPDEVYFSSELYEESQFDAIDTEGPVSSFEDMFIAKLNASGEYQWVREVPGEGFMGTGNRTFLNLDHNGNIYFGGRSGGNITWGNGIQTSSPAMSGDLLILKYNPQGEILMAQTAGGTGDDRIDAISLSHSGDIYLSGMVRGNATFGSINTEAEPFVAYPFLAKMSQGELDRKDYRLIGISVYPNPATNHINIDNVSAGTAGTIHNLLGQRIKDIEVTGNPISIEEMESGLYLLSIKDYVSIKFQKK